MNFYSRGDQSFPSRERPRSAESDGTAAEEEVVGAVRRNRQPTVATRAGGIVPHALRCISTSYIFVSLKSTINFKYAREKEECIRKRKTWNVLSIFILFFFGRRKRGNTYIDHLFDFKIKICDFTL